MDTLREAVLLLSFCAVCGLLFHFLLPEGNVSRMAKTVMSLLMLCALCTPLFRVLDAFDGASGNSRIFSSFGERDTTFPEDLYRQTVEKEVCGVCGDIVKKYTDVPYEITADVHISDDGGIRIERVRIVFDALPEGRDAIEKEITEACGIVPAIGVKHEDG